MVELGTELIACILSFLAPKEIMCARGVSNNWRDAATITIVPPVDFCVDSVEKYNAMTVMTEAMPNLQQITLRGFGRGHKYSDGEDPDPDEEWWAAETADWTTHDIEIIFNFSKLCILKITGTSLNGRYSFLFNSFPLLQKLSIDCDGLKWDLEMLAGFPRLKELHCTSESLTGNIKSLRVLKDTLETVDIDECDDVEGNFMDLADFPHLKVLNLEGTAVIGDIRDIGEDDFPSLKFLFLPKGVYGGRGYEMQRIVDAPDLVRAVYDLFKKQRPTLEMRFKWYGALSEDSPDWYESADEDNDTPPLYVCFVEAGSRVGYRWESEDCKPCEVNWLDPEPDRESSDYGEYIEELQEIECQKFYGGFHQPPTEEEYHQLWERLQAEGEWWWDDHADESEEDGGEEEEYDNESYDSES
jgi:hypothetical protein